MLLCCKLGGVAIEKEIVERRRFLTVVISPARLSHGAGATGPGRRGVAALVKQAGKGWSYGVGYSGIWRNTCCRSLLLSAIAGGTTLCESQSRRENQPRAREARVTVGRNHQGRVKRVREWVGGPDRRPPGDHSHQLSTLPGAPSERCEGDRANDEFRQTPLGQQSGYRR